MKVIRYIFLLLFLSGFSFPVEREYCIGYRWYREWTSTTHENFTHVDSMVQFRAVFYIFPAKEYEKFRNSNPPPKSWQIIFELPQSRRKYGSLPHYEYFCTRLGQTLIKKYRKKGYKVINTFND